MGERSLLSARSALQRKYLASRGVGTHESNRATTYSYVQSLQLHVDPHLQIHSFVEFV
jgi:hypothetical protein